MSRAGNASGIVLIRISGKDKPGLLGTLMQVFENFELRILDIGQAVVHGTLSLAFKVELERPDERVRLYKDILYQVHELDLSADFSEIEPQSYDEWVQLGGRSYLIVSLIGRRIAAGHLRRVCAVLLAHGLNINTIRRMSHRVARGNGDGTHERACIEFQVSGEGDPDTAAMKAEFMAVCQELGIDIALQKDNLFRRNRRLVVFDMDSTLIQQEVIDELAREAGVGERVAAITARAMRGEIDFRQSFRERLGLLAGLDAAVLPQVADRLTLTDGCERLFANLRMLGYRTAIVSGGFEYFGRRLQDCLGVDYLHANALEVVDGRLSGRVQGAIIDGERKAALLREIAAREQISLEQVIAVGDGANDLPMLRLAGLGIAFHAKPLVRTRAGHAISTLGLDSILYLIGMRDFESRERPAQHHGRC